jgi:hypothetical protein
MATAEVHITTHSTHDYTHMFQIASSAGGKLNYLYKLTFTPLKLLIPTDPTDIRYDDL